jgi:TonB family protein
MFAQLNLGTAIRQRKVLGASLTLHCLLFAWLLHSTEPQLINPTSVALGRNGRVLAQIYWPTQSPDDSDTSSSDRATEVYRHQRVGHDKLTWKRITAPAKLPPPSVTIAPSGVEDDAKIATLSHLGHGATAGHPYGTVPGGPVYGDEIRPALPVSTADPVAFPWELPESEGRVVVEIVIDERGEIVRKTVLESMGSKLDQKVLAALENWRFQPATHNGVAIASKQDAIFHFHARG